MDTHPYQRQSKRGISGARHAPGFVALVLAGLLFLTGCWPAESPPEPGSEPPVVRRPAAASVSAAIATGSVFEQFQFKEVHTDFQRSYLQLIQNINGFNSPQIDIRDQKLLFSEYGRAQRKYKDVLKKIAVYAADQKLRCFSIMKSLILAILYYDKKTNKKMFKYDPEKLLSEKILLSIPICPDGGEYSIIYKDGRRLFRCSVHGVLRQN